MGILHGSMANGNARYGESHINDTKIGHHDDYSMNRVFKVSVPFREEGRGNNNLPFTGSTGRGLGQDVGNKEKTSIFR